MNALPTGTVTLMFTDIEGSTQLLDRLEERYTDVLLEHRRVLRDIFAEHGGVEVSTEGDAFFVAFASATEALAAATEAQPRLSRAGPVNVRIGMHTGEPTIADGTYVGMDVHRAARVAAAGHGGQVLLTDATRSLIPSKDHLQALGRHRLKDVGELSLFQVGDTPFPPLKGERSGNLPPPAGPLIGRDDEAATLEEGIRDGGARLLTVVGPGGIGKSTLAIDVARRLADQFADGVWLVDLSPSTTSEEVRDAIAATMGATMELEASLRDRRALFVLDNFEQLIDAGGEIARLLDAAAGVVFLVTSREPLHLRMEHVHAVPALSEQDAATLFRRRAEAVVPGFDASPEVLAQICRRLDRIPLALELAAARARVLQPEQLLERLDHRLPVLTGGARDAPVRQRTLRATIEWSHDLLTDEERTLFARLAVFAGGWTLEAAQDVCRADLDALEALLDKSLVDAEAGRFRMLETIREFAEERLIDDDGPEVRQRHAEHYLALSERAEPELTGPQHIVWLDRLASDYENLRAASGWLERSGDVEAAMRLSAGLVFFWFLRGRYAEGLGWLDHAMGVSTARSPARMRALWGAGFLCAIVGDLERSARLLHECHDLAAQLGDTSMIARALDILGLVAFFENDLDLARSSLERSIALAREADDRWCLADALGTLGSIYPLIGDFASAEAAGTEALKLARRNEDRQGMRMALLGLALAGARRGRSEPARAAAAEGLAICREIGDPFFSAYFLWVLATVAVDEGELDLAGRYARKGLQLAREIEAPLLILCLLEVSGAIELRRGARETAVPELEEAAEIGRSGSVPFSYVATVLRTLSEADRETGDEGTASERLLQALSLAQDVGDAWGEARALSAIASVEPDVEVAGRHAGDALAIQARIGDEIGLAATRRTMARRGIPAG